MIRNFEVYNLNGEKNFKFEFNEDLNILTGKNGSGKTTLLKLLWYLLSGKVDEAATEIEFEYTRLETDELIVEINKDINIKYKYKTSQGKWVEEEIELLGDDYRLPIIKRRQQFEQRRRKLEYISGIEKSIFFPTFRRIEGGFPNVNMNYRRTYEEELDQVMSNFANSLSTDNHLFITSISTNDIKQLLIGKYAQITEDVNKLHSKMNRFITKEISEIDEKSQSADKVLRSIKEKVDEVEMEKRERNRNFELLSQIVEKLFEDKGIKLSESITLGDKAAQALSSSLLSAGEKQMLSFLCYNLFYSNSTIFIDEPEISLHVDWQRMLMKVLFSQESSNQYIISTHSPFIISKYSDKELTLDNDRGGF